MLPMLQIGPFNIQTAGLIMILAIWSGMVISEKLNKSSTITPNQVSDVLFWGLGGTIVLARLGYSFSAPDVLFQNPLNLISLNSYQFDAFSGLVGFFFAIVIYSSRKKIPFRMLLDTLIPFFLCVATGYVLSNLVSGEVYGSPATVPWAIPIRNIPRHPVQVYEIVAIFLAGLFYLRLLPGHNQANIPGNKFLIILGFLALGQIIIIPFRGDPGITSINGIRLEQIAAWIILAGTILILEKWLQPVQSKQENFS